MFDCSSRLVSSCSTRSTARVASPEASAWSTASLRWPCSANHVDAVEVELFDPVGTVTVESAAQEFGEHLVVAKPVRVVVDPLQEQAAPLDLFEHRLPAWHSRQRGRQPAAGPLGDRCRQQELGHLRFRGCPGHFRPGIRRSSRLRRTSAHKAGGVAAAAQDKRRQLQGGGPAVGRRGQRFHVAFRQLQATDVVQQRRAPHRCRNAMSQSRFRPIRPASATCSPEVRRATSWSR